MLSGCRTSKSLSKIDTIDDNYRVFYQIFVGSFSDSNNDGIGDLRGIINRIDYLNDGNIDSEDSLHVQGIWLSPIFSSPSYHKYDVNDYYTIDEQFGTMDDLKELIDKAHQRNVKVILDLVINHTSTNHEWFKAFVKAHQDNAVNSYYYDFYSYVKDGEQKPNTAYHQIPGTNDYYECNFSEEMPELNYDNWDVRNAVVDIAKYYLDMGIDGFRFDAGKYIYYGDNTKSVAFWDWYMKELKKMKPDVYTVCEVWSSDNETIEYIKALNCFNFTSAMTEGIIASTAKGNSINFYTNYIESYLNKIHASRSDAMYIPFIANHDTDRAAGYLNVTDKYMYMGANLYILCSGSPFIYYGEEIGMKGTRGAANTDANRRLAMLWGDGDSVSDPEGSSFSASKQVNGTVSEQLKNSDSLLHYYNRLIKFRNSYPEIARGEYTKLSTSSSYLGGFSIDYEGSTTYLLHNVSLEEISVEIDLQDITVTDSIGQGTASYKDGILTVSGQTSVVLK